MLQQSRWLCFLVGGVTKTLTGGPELSKCHAVFSYFALDSSVRDRWIGGQTDGQMNQLLSLDQHPGRVQVVYFVSECSVERAVKRKL